MTELTFIRITTTRSRFQLQSKSSLMVMRDRLREAWIQEKEILFLHSMCRTSRFDLLSCPMHLSTSIALTWLDFINIWQTQLRSNLIDKTLWIRHVLISPFSILLVSLWVQKKRSAIRLLNPRNPTSLKTLIIVLH